jgi:hypothetical protein
MDPKVKKKEFNVGYLVLLWSPRTERSVNSSQNGKGHMWSSKNKTRDLSPRGSPSCEVGAGFVISDRTAGT